jgi:lysophospholipase L1-like esterase
MHMRFCFFGDSIVNGTGDPDCLGWVGRVCAAARQRDIDVTSYNLGIRRDTSADILRRWRQEADIRLPAEYPRRLVFSFGVNDCIHENGECRAPPVETISNAQAIMSAAAAYAPTLMIGPAPIAEPDANHRVHELIPGFRAVCRELNIPFLDVFDRLKSSATWTREIAQGDGAHPGRQGYQELAALVNEWPAWRT